MRTLLVGVALAIGVMTGPALAGGQQSISTASNGVPVNVETVAAAAQYEYSSPPVDLSLSKAERGFVIAYRGKRAGTLYELQLLSAFFYPGAWRHYRAATFDDGAPARIGIGGHGADTCPGGPCTVNDEISINLSPTEIAAHARNGELRVQISAADGKTQMLRIPLTYLEAVNEVAGRP